MAEEDVSVRAVLAYAYRLAGAFLATLPSEDTEARRESLLTRV